MRSRLPGPRTHDTPEHYGFGVPVLLPDLRRFRTGRPVDDAVATASELVADGCLAALAPDPGDDVAALATALRDAGLADHCELDVAAAALVGPVLAAGVAVALVGPEVHPAARVVVRADEPGAEERCRAHADRRVRLVRGRPQHGWPQLVSQGSDLAFVRCLNDLMAGAGRPGIAATDPRLIAIAGERAAWNGRSPDSWEHVLPYGTLTDERRRLVASGCTVRVSVRVGRGRS
jgi:proline dehydrogenase